MRRAGAIKCGACGAKVREDRPRCLRCGAPLAAAPGPPASGRGVSFPVLMLAAGVMALGGFGALMLGPSARSAGMVDAAAAAGAPGTASSEGVPERPAAPTTPAPVAASMDVSRGGIASYNSGDVAGAVEQFEAAVAADPENADALNNLGQVLVRSGRAAEAIPYFDRAIELSGAVWAYRFNRARAYAELREWPRAVAGYRDAARLFPGDYVTAFNLARALQAGGDLSGAIAEFQRAIALAPGEPDFLLSLAYALETAQRPADAIQAYRQYLELQDDAAQVEKVEARLAQLEGQPAPGTVPQTP